MQPTFLPWIGYFAMIAEVDTFVFLDSVQFAKRSWQQRNRIKTPQGEEWLTVPIRNKGRRDQFIQDTLIDSDNQFAKKTIQTLTTNYSKSPFFKTYSPQIFKIIYENRFSLCELNIALIRQCAEYFGIEKSKFLRSSSLPRRSRGAGLLVSICNTLGANHYLSAPGSRAYLSGTDVFEKADIKLSYHEYEHPIYNQLYGNFLPYLCIVDLLFNEGDRSFDIIKSGVNRQVEYINKSPSFVEINGELVRDSVFL